MNILHLHPGADTGGQSMMGKDVLEASGDSVRVFVHSYHKFGYQPAEKWDDEDVRDSYVWADVVVVHNDPGLYLRAHNGHAKPVVVHHHGSIFRGNPNRIYAAAEAIGARQIVSTVDLLLSVPEGGHAEWIPQLVDLDRMRAMRTAHYTARLKPLVVHAPTNKQIKGTRYFTREMRKLIASGEASWHIIRNQPWTMCLAYKAMADLFIDQLHLGYGNNAIEAWGMGIPVIAGAHEPIIARMRQEYGGELPFYRTTPDSILEDLRLLIGDPRLRAEYAARGEAHVERYHAPAAWVERTRRLYLGDRVSTLDAA